MDKHKTLIFIVSYNAEKHIENLLYRIKNIINNLSDFEYEVLLIDDASKDRTTEIAKNFNANNDLNLTMLKNPINQGYGGNQKIGYQYGIRFGFDSVVLLHGDGQYPPEAIYEMLRKLIDSKADLVLGSRMLNKISALKGKMPIYKFVGNIILTKIQNFFLSTKLSELHTGFKAYRTERLKNLPFAYNSNDFDFDTDIIIQHIVSGARIEEIAIPTHYGDEVCNVNGVKYALQVIRNSFLAKVQKYNIYYHPKYDFTPQERYESKVNFDSSHTYAIDNVDPNSRILDIGGASGYVAEVLKNDKSCKVFGVDQCKTKKAEEIYEEFRQIDLDNDDIGNVLKNDYEIDTILMLDVIEHLNGPEEFLKKFREAFAAQNPKIIITTGNIGFIIMRFSLLIGNFTYGKRGILDFTHKRLFTFYSLKKLFKLYGYSIEKVEGIPVPFEFVIKNKKLADVATRFNRVLMKISRSLFSFQIGMVVRPLPTIDILLDRAGEKNVNQ